MAGGNPKPWIGVTATPAIDMSSNTMYVVSEQKTASGNNFRLHALNIRHRSGEVGQPGGDSSICTQHLTKRSEWKTQSHYVVP